LGLQFLLKLKELVIEKKLKVKAKRNLLPIQPGDVAKTSANIDESKRELNFNPKTSLSSCLLFSLKTERFMAENPGIFDKVLTILKTLWCTFSGSCEKRNGFIMVVYIPILIFV